MNKRVANLLYIFMIMLVVALCIYLYFFTHSEGYACGKNPFVYGASKMENDIECSCTQTNTYCPATFYFNATSFETPVTKCASPIQSGDFDISAFNITRE